MQEAAKQTAGAKYSRQNDVTAARGIKEKTFRRVAVSHVCSSIFSLNWTKYWAGLIYCVSDVWCRIWSENGILAGFLLTQIQLIMSTAVSKDVSADLLPTAGMTTEESNNEVRCPLYCMFTIVYTVKRVNWTVFVSELFSKTLWSETTAMFCLRFSFYIIHTCRF